eukprot:5327285-Prymnesium_polylepis.1
MGARGRESGADAIPRNGGCTRSWRREKAVCGGGVGAESGAWLVRWEGGAPLARCRAWAIQRWR